MNRCNRAKMVSVSGAGAGARRRSDCLLWAGAPASLPKAQAYYNTCCILASCYKPAVQLCVSVLMAYCGQQRHRVPTCQPFPLPEHSFEDLAGRFERPDPRNRWDAPLFTVVPGKQGSMHLSAPHAHVCKPVRLGVDLGKGSMSTSGSDGNFIRALLCEASCVKPLV